MSSPFVGLLARWLVLALGVIIATHLVPGIHCSDAGALVAVVVLLSLFNAILRPVLVLFTLPFIIVTMGLGIVVINAILFLFVARIVDGSDFTEFSENYGPATVCGRAAIEGFGVGVVTNNGPLDPDGANKATHFIQACRQTRTPILYLNNTTGYIVGRAAEQGGMIKHGSKMIQAVASAGVPQITLYCGASFGAGNYGMCGRGFHPRFCFSWPNAKTAVMGAEQAAETMAIVAEAAAARRGGTLDKARRDKMKAEISAVFDAQSGSSAVGRHAPSI